MRAIAARLEAMRDLRTRIGTQGERAEEQLETGLGRSRIVLGKFIERLMLESLSSVDSSAHGSEVLTLGQE